MSFHQEGDENKGKEKTTNRQQGTVATTTNQETALLQNSKIVCRRYGEDGHKYPECRAPTTKIDNYQPGKQTGTNHLISGSLTWDDLPDTGNDDTINYMFVNSQAPTLRKQENNNTSMSFSQTTQEGLPESWVLLDNQ